MVENQVYGPGGTEVFYDGAIESGTVSGMSCTSGFTNRALELQQKFRRRRSRSRSKKAGKTKTRADGLPELSEEYDIQTVVSGLTRNSEFPEIRDPPISVQHGVDHGVNNGIDQSSEWPDDETLGQKGHHVIRVMDGDQVMSKSTVRSPKKYNRVSEFQKEQRDHETMNTKARSRRKNRASRVHKEKRSPLSEPKELRSSRSFQKKRVPEARKEKSAPLPEPEETRSEMPSKEAPSPSEKTGPREDPKSHQEILISPEPDGVKLRNGTQKVAIEPAGMKIETLIYGSSPATNGKKNKPRRITPTVYMNEDDVEVVYQENSVISSKRENKFARRRSKSTDARKSTRQSGYPTINSNEKENDNRRQGRSRSVDARKRSRSLPRTLKRITSRYRKGPDYKRDPSPSKYMPHTSDLNSIDPNFDPNFVDEIFSAVGNRTVSTLGSQCEGIESLALKVQEMKRQERKLQEVKNESAKYSPPQFSPYSREGVFTSHPCEMESDASEPRVCVEFGARHSGGYFNTTTYENEDSNNQANYENHNKVDTFPQNYPGKEPNVPENASELVYPSFDKATLPQKFSNNNNRDKLRINAIAAEASRNLLLSPNGEDDSCSGSLNLFERSRSVPNSNRNMRVDYAKFGRNRSNHVSMPSTLASEKELRQECVGHKSSDYIDEQAMARLSMTSSGRKDLIQRYLALREQHNQLGAPVSGGRSVSSAYSIHDTNSIVHNASVTTRRNNTGQKSGYDDASSHYNVPDAEQWAFGGEFPQQSEQLPVQPFPNRMREPPAPLSSGSISRMRRSNAEGRNTNRNMEKQFSMPGAYKQQINESWKSPTNVSSFPFSQQENLQEKLSYSYASDDDSNAFDGYRANVNSPYDFPAQSNYEEELAPHNQFMKMKIGFGNQ